MDDTLSPFSTDEKFKILRNKGVDPDKFDISDDTFEVVPRTVTTQPTSAPIGQVSAKPSNKYSALQSFGINAGMSLAPTMAGVAAGAGTTALISSPLEAAVGPGTIAHALLTGVGGIAGGVAGSLGGEYLQRKILEQSDIGNSILASQVQASQEHPYASMLGSLGAQALSLRPSAKMMGDVGRAFAGGDGVMNSLGRVVTNPAAQNIAIGAGVGAGQGAYEEIQSPDPEIDYTRFGLNTLGGALLHHPTRLGEALGVHPYEAPASFDRYRGGVDMSMPTEVKAKPSISGADFAREPKLQGDLNINSEKKLVNSQKRSDKMAGWEESDPILQKDELARLSDEGGRVVEEPEVENKVNDFYQAKKELEDARLERQKVELQKETQAELIEKARLLEEMKASAVKPEDKIVKPLAKTNTGEDIMTDYTGVTEQSNSEAANESAADLEARRLEGHTGDKYQEDTGETVKKSPAPEGLLKANVNLANQRGVDMTVSRTPITSPEGKPVTGVADIANSKSTITSERPDTGFHEVTHFTVADLEPRLKSRLLDRVAGDKKAQDWIAKEKATGRNPDAEEYVAQAAGEDDLRRIKNRDQNLVRDLTAWAKVNISRNASSDDVVRFLTNKAVYGAPHEVVGNISAKPVAPVTKAQDEAQAKTSPFQKIREEVIGKDTPQPTREESKAEAERVRLKDQQAGRYQDKEQKPVVSPEEREEAKTRYHENDKQLGVAIKSMNEPEIQRYWKIKEEIKNKYFQGHSPEGYELDKKAGRIKEQDKEQGDVDSLGIPKSGPYVNYFKNAMGYGEGEDIKSFYDKKEAELHREFDRLASSKGLFYPSKYPEKAGNFNNLTLLNIAKKLKAEGRKDMYAEEPYDDLTYDKNARKILGDKIIDEFLNRKEYLSNQGSHILKVAREQAINKLDEDLSVDSKGKPLNKIELKSSVSNRNQDSEQSDTNIDTSRQGFIRALEPSFDAVKRISKPLSQAFHNFESRRDQHTGLRNETLSKLKPYSPEDINTVAEAHRNYYRIGDTEPTFTGDQAEISQHLKDYYGRIADIRREAKLTINDREAGKNPYYVPDQLNDATLDLFINKPYSVQAKAAKREWAEHLAKETKTSVEEATKDVNDYIEALGGDRNTYKALNFGAIRKAAGHGLPESLREADATKSLMRYGKRAAADLALFQELESKPEIAAALNIPDPRTGEIPKVKRTESISQAKEVRQAMQWVNNNFSGKNSNPKFSLVARIVNNALLGPATGIRDTMSIINNALPDIHHMSNLSAFVKGVTDFRANTSRALRTAAMQPHIDKLQFNEIMESPDRAEAIMSKVASALRVWQGREHIENANRIITFGIGRDLAQQNIIGAKAGDVKAKSFLEKYNTLVDGDVTTIEGEKLNHALDQMAKNFVDRNQGTYGGRGLPITAMEGPLAPFMALQKWSIEKSNVIYQDVYKPFMSGKNRMPMLTYLLGSVLTGAAIQEINKTLSGRKPQDASISETAEVPTAENIAAQLATLMQLGSYAGVVGDGVKWATDIAVKGKAPRNLLSFPTATSALDLQEKIADFSEAIHQGGDSWEVAKQFTLDLLTHNIQALRAISNHTTGKEDIDRSDKFRDLRVFRELTGSPAGEPTKSNPYMDIENKKFKRSGDLAEAASYLPDIYEKFAEKASQSPEKAMKFLSNLKANSFQTMPSVESSPQEFVTYWNYLLDTQGEDKAIERLMDFYKQSGLNKAKSGMIP